MGQQQQQQEQEAPVEAPAPAPVMAPPQPANSDVLASMPKAPAPGAGSLLPSFALGDVGNGLPAWANPFAPTDGAGFAEARGAMLAAPVTTEPAKPFTQLGIDGQMGYMADLMNDNRALLDANNVSADMEQKMAAQVPREIDENSRRASVASDFNGQALKLQKAMKGVDMNDPAAVAKLTKGLNEEQRFLLGKVQGGQLDLSTLGSEDKAVQAANKEKMAELGIELRSNQYAEMEGLRKRQEGGEKLGKDDAARLAELKKKPAYMAGASGMGAVWGLSKDRFAEIYAAGNTRFEAKHYQRLRDSYIKNQAANDKVAAAYAKDPTQKAPSDTVLAGSGIGNFDISQSGQTKIRSSGTYDILGDIATSYGAGQVMGGYAASDDWKGRSAKAERLQPITLPDGTSYTPTFADVKASGRTHDPDANDLKIQMSLVKMGLGKQKRFDPEGKGLGTTMSNHDYITMYNGHKPGDQVYNQYMDSLTTNGPIYAAKKKALTGK